MFDCLAQYTNKTANELRNITASSLEINENFYINLMPDYRAMK